MGTLLSFRSAFRAVSCALLAGDLSGPLVSGLPRLGSLCFLHARWRLREQKRICACEIIMMIMMIRAQAGGVFDKV